MRRDLFSSIVQTHYVHYFFELGGVNLPMTLVGDVGEFIADFAVGSEVPADDLGLRDVAIRLRLNDLVDLSRDHLDARQANHAAVVHIETAIMLLTSLKTFARLKPSDGPRRAAALANRYKNALMGDDITGKTKLARATADLFRGYRRQIRDRGASLMLDVYASDATAVADHLPLAMGMLGLVYEELMYPIPPYLLSLEGFAETAESVPETGGDAAAGKLAIHRELEGQREELSASAEAFSGAWRLSARERRQRGFDEMQRVLVNGYPDVAGGAVLAAVPKEQARQVIDTLAGLDALVHAAPEEEVPARLEAVLAEEQVLRRRAAELQATARTADVQLEVPAVARVGQVVELLLGNWPDYRQLIIETWPGRQGREVVERLESILRQER
jgi:hypothetical protein